MIRIVHFADFHLGTEAYGRMDPETGLPSRVVDFLAVLDAMVEYALGNDVHLVVFAGDAYKTRDPNPTYQREFNTRILKLARAGIPVVLVVGNHDLAPAEGRASTLDVFTTFSADNVYVGRTIGLLRIDTKAGPVQVVTLPWVLRSRFLTKEATRGKSVKEVDEMLIETILRLLNKEKQGLSPDVPAILAAHASIQGAAFGVERNIMLGQDLLLPAGDIADPAFDYVALGHIHKHQVLRESPLVVYAGSMERVDFGEEKEEKGFVVAEVEKGRARFEFHPVPARRMVSVRVDVKSDDPTQEVLKAIARAKPKGAIIRVSVRATEDQALRIDQKALRDALADAFFVASVNIDVDRQTRTRLGVGALEQLTPEQILARYLEQKGEPKERFDLLLEKGSEVLKKAATGQD
ncbi:MAG: exonuclease SbcCD subunit D [Anaerolineae bacterium]|nr:exonuclease SbcCD subunit D [Anaerolineae bacterium]